MAMARQSPTLKPREAANLRAFVAWASNHWASSQTEFADRTGISQAMLSGVISGRKAAGGRTLRAISAATGIAMDDILNGSGLPKLQARTQTHTAREQAEQRMRAAEALARLYEMSYDEVVAIFDELGVLLPPDVDATVWFDVGRAAIERRKAGLALTRRVPR